MANAGVKYALTLMQGASSTKHQKSHHSIKHTKYVTCTIFSRVSAHGCLQLTGQKTGVGTYTDKSFVCITRIVKRGGGGGEHTKMGAYSSEYRTYVHYFTTWGVCVLTE